MTTFSQFEMFMISYTVKLLYYYLTSLFVFFFAFPFRLETKALTLKIPSPCTVVVTVIFRSVTATIRKQIRFIENFKNTVGIPKREVTALIV